MEFPVFDFHCDTSDLLSGLETGVPASLKGNSGHIDLDRAEKLPGYAQCFACFTTTGQINPTDAFEKKLSAVMRELAVNADRIRQAFSAEDIENNLAAGMMSAVLSIEGPAGFGYDPELLEDLYKIGFRISTLGWNEDNILTGSHLTGGGLTDQGRAYVAQAQKLGMLIDVSHISDKGFWDIIECTQAPVIASHSNSRSICDCSRNLTDDMFRAICQTGGVAGINLYASFLGDAPTIDTVCDHIFRFLELDPDGKHIAFGGDLDGCDTLPTGFNGIQDYPLLAERLVERGLDKTTVYNIFWNNALEVLKRCCT